MPEGKQHSVTVTLVHIEQIEDDWPGSYSTKLTECIEWFQDKLGQIPEEFRKSAKCVIDSEDRFGSPYASITVTYTRPESAEENIQRVFKERHRMAQEEAQERATLNYLMAKYKDR